MSLSKQEWRGFDPKFDDTTWTEDWMHIPLALVPPGEHRSGYRVERRVLEHFEVFGRPMKLTLPMEFRLLFDPEGRLWMSDTPQERIMMYNNGQRTQGHVLVGGLGLGLYLQYAQAGAAGQATNFTVVERSPIVRDIVEPTLSATLNVPFEVTIGDVETYLAQPADTHYDTIFLDTWDTLNALHLPTVNRLRNLAQTYLAPQGQVLLWGYGWMVRLYEEACRQLLQLAPGQRRAWLAAQAVSSPQAVALLRPVIDRYDDEIAEDLEKRLTWCRQHIVQQVASLD
jgi:hypothetical protein